MDKTTKCSRCTDFDEMTFLDRFAEIINRKVEQKRMTYTALSELCGVSRITMGAIVNRAKTDIKLSTIFKICDVAEISIMDILKDCNN